MEEETLDRTKMNIDMSAYNINGNELEELLMKRGIFLELCYRQYHHVHERNRQ